LPKHSNCVTFRNKHYIAASPLFDWVLSARPIWLTPFLLWSGFILVIYMVNRADGH